MMSAPLLLSCFTALVLLILLWMRVTARDRAVARHRRVTSYLDWHNRPRRKKGNTSRLHRNG